jgi:glycosyltransferase involved in cell wall biosynthesis
MKKNILHIIYQTNIIWWVETFISTLLSWSKNKDILVQVYNKKNNTWIKNRIINLWEKIHSYNPFILLYQTFKRAFQYKNICKAENIDISISHWDSLNLSNIISKVLFKNKSKIYIFLHNSLSFYTNKGSSIYKYLFNYFYPKADKVITISKEMALEFKRQWYKNIETLYNPIDFKYIDKLKNEDIWEYEKIFQTNKKTFITIWRLEKVKNIEFIINSFNIFNKENKDFQLIILWDWKEKNNLEKIVNKIWNKNIYLIWKQDNVYKFLNKSNYFLFSSLNEWFWRVLIESLACNTPILTHDFKYWAKEIIRNNNNFSECNKIEVHENWILTPYMDKESFIKWIDLITKTNFDKNKIKSNIEKYNIENLNKDWEKIINN